MTTRALHWFRRDLRVKDNRALHTACSAADDGVVGVYVISPGEWKAHDDAPVKIDFWLRNLAELRTALGRLNIPLRVARAASPKDVPGVLNDVAHDAGCDALYYNREYEVDESRRDAAVMKLFEKRGHTVHPFDDRCVLVPGEVVTKDAGFYTVFTPFQNRFLETLEVADWSPLPTPKKQKRIAVDSDDTPGWVDGFESDIDPKPWPAGEKAAAHRLHVFIEERAEDYEKDRDFPALDGTSVLSPYLNSGAISPRVCLRAAIDADGGKLCLGKRYKGRPTGYSKWISELIWREFYIHMTHNFPRVSMGRAFKAVDRAIPWRYDDDDFHAWCEGHTGFPLVDAAMRQLNATGWMHNRLRMVAAMFLTKDLLIDWRWGERYFMRHLIDGDLASNNGGWQWSASTGADAAPYFRIYNPTSQAERFDPDGDFIQRWVPELAGVAAKGLFEPERLPVQPRSQLNYPAPMVDHKEARERAVKVFKAAGQSRRRQGHPGLPGGGQRPPGARLAALF